MSDLRFVAVWRQTEPKHAADAKAYWEARDLVPDPEERERRTEQLCALVYSGERVVADSTAFITTLTGLKAKFAMIRVSVDPEFRRKHLAVDLTNFTRMVLEVWSAQHPEEEVKGMSAIFVAKELDEVKSEAIGPRTNLVLIGYLPQGQQIRVAWFRHARV